MQDQLSVMPCDAIEIRLARDSDADAFVELFAVLDDDSEFMLYEPGERRLSAGAMLDRIVRGRDSGREILIVAATQTPDAIDDKTVTLAGFIGAIRPGYFRGNHSLNLVLGVRRSASGQGIGTRLLQALEADARTLGIHRMGLGVLSTNTRAIELYERAGFQLEGCRKDAIRLRSGYVDERFMAKLLTPENVVTDA